MGDRSVVSPSRIRNQIVNMNKPINGMDIDEFLKNMIPVEGAQTVQNPSCSSSSSPSTSLGNMTKGTMSRKTIDEMWREIVHPEQAGVNGNNAQTVNHHQQFGETTLEDFLVHAGVFNQSVIHHDNGHHYHQIISGIDPTKMISHQMMDRNFHVPESVCENPSGTVPSQGASSGDRRRHCSEEMMDKTIERRQKRMIKNRESAARSRARKQAHTKQLELELKQLRERNTWLKKQKEMDLMLSSKSTLETKYQLRRTSSAPF